MEFMNVVLDNGVMLMLLMIGLIQAAITFGKIKGTRNIYMVSLGIGVVLMLAYQFCYFGVPTMARGWFDVVALGLISGALAPSLYKAGEKLIERGAEKLAELLAVLVGK